MTEYRIADYRYLDYPEDIQQRLNNLVKNYSQDRGYDHEFQYRWARFTADEWFLACLADPQACEVLNNVKT